MTPQDALAAAMTTARSQVDFGSPRQYAPATLAALPAGWRLTDEPEVTVEALARAEFEYGQSQNPLPHYREGFNSIPEWSKKGWRERAAAILAALRGAS